MLFFKQIVTILWTAITAWPKLKPYFQQISDWISKLIKLEKSKQEDKQLDKITGDAKQSKDTSGLENLIGGPQAHASDPDKPVTNIVTASAVEEKKSPSVVQSANPRLATFIKIAGAGVALAAADALLKPQKAQAAEMSMMGFSNQASVDLSHLNRVEITGSMRMGSKLLGLALLLFMNMGASSCQTNQENRPNYTPEIFAGDSSKAGIYRKQSNEFVPANSSEFDDFAAMRYHDLACVYKSYVANCVKFESAIVDCSNLTPEQIDYAKRLIKGPERQ